MIELLLSAIRLTVPILLVGMGAVFSERGGIVNIGLEGMMIVGTFFGAVGAIFWGPAAGMGLAIAAGAAIGALHALTTVTFRVNHIVSGVAINLLAAGAVRFLNILLFETATQSPGTPSFPALAGLSPLVFVSVGLVALGHWALRRTAFGLRLRAVGENPLAADTLGVPVARMQYAGVLLSGMLAALAGAYLSIEQAKQYLEGMTQGRGYIGIAAMIFGNWWPLGAALSAALFGFFDALSLRWEGIARYVDALRVVPEQLISTLPYVASILVLAGVVRRAQPPAAAGTPYTKGEER